MKTKKLKNGTLDPPADLSAASQAIWSALVPRRAKSAERLTLLAEALRCLDVATTARELVSEEGMIVSNLATRTKHVHPAVKIAQESAKQFSKIWVQLKLDATSIDGTYPGWETKPGIGLPKVKKEKRSPDVPAGDSNP